jgi:hypothetical protein
MYFCYVLHVTDACLYGRCGTFPPPPHLPPGIFEGILIFSPLTLTPGVVNFWRGANVTGCIRDIHLGYGREYIIGNL